MAIILEELGLPYETRFIEMANIKKEPFISINPNGRYESPPPYDELLFEISWKNSYLAFQPLKTPTLESPSGNPAPLSSTWLRNTTPPGRSPSNPRPRSINSCNGFISRCLAKALILAKPSGLTDTIPKNSHRPSKGTGTRRNG